MCPNTESGIAAIEREQSSMPIDIDGPRLYQPSSRHCPPSSEPSLPEFRIDPISEHTILLNQYAKNIRHLISVVQQQYYSVKSNGDGLEPLNFPPTPPIPPFTQPPEQPRNTQPLPFMAKHLDSDFQRGCGVSPQLYNDVTTRKLLRRAVAVVLTHAGFDTCTTSMLETVTDICDEFMTRMTSSLRHLRDREAHEGYTGFPDIMDHLFHDMGLGDVTTIHDFYQSRIVSYHHHMMKTCRQLVDDYERVKNPDFRHSGEFKMARVKEEPMSDIQFPTFMSDDEESTSQQSEMESLHGLSGLDVVDTTIHDMSQSSTLQNEDATKWMHNIKPEPLDTKGAVLDAYDDISEDDPSPTPDIETVHDQTTRETGVIADILSSPSLTNARKKTS